LTRDEHPVRRIATIGVYEYDAPRFIEALQSADVRKLLDVRQRRGVRGPARRWIHSSTHSRRTGSAH
jgi:hypothetical protein